jgi:UDP-3-O-[3-hydroxymyristoyl] glucosamine N-acyltransferase
VGVGSKRTDETLRGLKQQFSLLSRLRINSLISKVSPKLEADYSNLHFLIKPYIQMILQSNHFTKLVVSAEQSRFHNAGPQLLIASLPSTQVQPLR